MISYQSNMTHHVRFSFFFIFIFLNKGFCDDEYKAGFASESESCSDFDNKDIKLELSLTPSDSDDEPEMSLEGTLGLGITLDSDHLLSIDILKETDTGSEVMWKVSMPVCDAIKDEDAPWKPVFKAMGIENCPIEAKDYDVKDMKIDMGFAQSFLNQNYVGYYSVQVKIEDQQKNGKSCYVQGVSIIEI